MTVEMFDSIINTSQDCVFWKDSDRRFLGVNQAFLDFYGFESEDVLIGKNDEDMGWHSDPEPFKKDELEVLAGKSTYKVQGKCFIRGEERDIIASKRPLYENGKIVGLVGSFVDITDVLRRKNVTDNYQTVYTIDKLRNFSFFDKIIDEISLTEILDPLTGIISRAYSVKFVRSLIAEKKPFTFTMLDLDNFKFINDTLGHSAGDKVLMTVSKRLAEFIDEDGIVGRFGGDELLMIDLKHTQKDDKLSFFDKLYSNSLAVRFTMDFGNGGSFITGTAGAASFPEDADNYTDLFSLIDKTLYIGKNKGRNCYTIYDAQKHKDISIEKIARRGIFTYIHQIRTTMENHRSFEDKLKAIMPVLSEILRVHDLYYARSDKRLKAVMNSDFEGDASDIDKLMSNDLFSENTLDDVKNNSPVFYNTLISNGFESALVVRIRKTDNVYGYLVCAVNRSLRIWQENECAVLYYVAGLLTE
ncbi:sensor domain-containing diguanylate cyclase [Treponema sp.]|uniref:sensor domain-containing diguanylate cyclase n=1 Tax=Treponema sp. TaxID=166 RepID=UPI00298E40E6|nr:diguanylate cyclase [Treponema sp.]MCR5612766.1 diguanylate cyclase [Treponema sp.]